MENGIISPGLKQKKKSRSKKWFWILGTPLVIALVLALSYLGYSVYSDWRYESDEKLYVAGAQYGYNEAVMQIVEGVNTCEPVPISYISETGNQTINVFKIECLEGRVQNE